MIRRPELRSLFVARVVALLGIPIDEEDRTRMLGPIGIRCWILLGLVVLSWGIGGVSAASLEAYATAIATADQQRQALEQMRELADPSFKDLLIALKEGALYTWQGRLLILSDSGVLNALAGQALLDASGHPFLPDDAEQVPLEEANSPLLQRALDVISLTDPDPRTRIAAALKLGNLRDPAAAGLIDKALLYEGDANVRRVMLEALYKLRLFDPDSQVRRHAVEHFAATRAESALALLKSLVQHEQDVTVNQAMHQAIASIDRYLRLRNVVGYAFNGLSLASVLLMMSLGLAITFGLMGVINMAHGEMLMLGSYTTYLVQESFAALATGYLDYFSQGLSTSYGDSQILWDVHLRVPEGQVVCLMGRNGVGKTTLLKSAMGLLPPHAGSITFDGQDITRVRPEQRARRGIGYVPQGREIFPQLTVLENLSLELLAKSGRQGKVPDSVFQRFPALSGVLSHQGGFLSGGQQQQLVIARALVTEPKFFLLDEPTEGIQPSIIHEIEEVIARIRAQGQVTILLVGQYLEFAWRLADAFYIMGKGSIVAHGDMRDLTEDVVKQYLTV